MSGPTAAPGGEAAGFEPAAAPGEAPAPPPRGPHEPGRRAGRYHTARGPMGLSGWLRLPAALLRARLGRVPERPWIVPAAAGWLGRRARRDWRVLELGSGRSTVWLARRTGSVLSFEDNEHWLARARGLLVAAGIENAEVRHLPVEHLAAEVDAMPGESFDLVVVDFLESPEADRVEAVRAARAKVRPGGYLLLDDSDRPGYAEAWELLGGWRERRFSGVKDEWPEACETAIFRRPQGSSGGRRAEGTRAPVATEAAPSRRRPGT